MNINKSKDVSEKTVTIPACVEYPYLGIPFTGLKKGDYVEVATVVKSADGKIIQSATENRLEIDACSKVGTTSGLLSVSFCEEM